MKKTIFYIASMMLAAAGFSSCDEDKAMPPIDQIIPQLTVDPNATILELKEAYNKPTNFYNTVVGTRDDGSHYIIRGRIISSTETGNIFKKLFVEDETSGICVSVNSSSLDDTYKIGRMVAIDCTGLSIGNYGGCMQLGAKSGDTNAPERMTEDAWTAATTIDGQLQVGGLKNPSALTPSLMTIAEVNGMSGKPAELLRWTNCLIRLEGVKFQNPGQTFADESKNNCARALVDAEGNSINLNNSGYSDFWYDKLPTGTGSVNCILTTYNGKFQLLISGLSDLVGFDEITGDEPQGPSQPGGDTPSGPDQPGGDTPSGSVTTLFSQAFTDGQGDWTIDNISLPEGLSYVWKQSNDYGMVASAYANSQSYASDAWLISPTLDLSAATNVSLSFEQAMNKFSSIDVARQQCSVAVSVEGGAWETIDIPAWPTALAWTFIKSGDASLKAYDGKKIRIGFHYTSVSGDSGSWEIKNLEVKGAGKLSVVK